MRWWPRSHLGLVLIATALIVGGCSTRGGDSVDPPTASRTVSAPRVASLADRLEACTPPRTEFRLVRSDVPRRFLLRAAVSNTVAGHHHVLRTITPAAPVVPSVAPAVLAPSLGAVLDQLGAQVPDLMPQTGPQPALLLPAIPVTGVLVGYQGAARLGATFEVYCDGAYAGRGHLSSWGQDTVGLLDCAIGAPRESLGALAMAYCPAKSRGRSVAARGGG